MRSPVTLASIIRAVREWYPRAMRTLGPNPNGRGCRYSEISIRLVWVWDGARWRVGSITQEESRGEA